MKPFIKPPLHRQLPRPRQAAGMSLIELMIAMTISLVLLTAVAGIFVSTSKARNEIERSSRQIENGRYAAEIISDDLRQAGFYGEFNVGSINPAAFPAALPDPCSLDPLVWDAAIPVHVQGYSSVAAAPGTCALPNLKPGTDVVVVRRVETCVEGEIGCGAVAAGRPYLQVSMCNATPAPPSYLMALGAVAPTLTLKNCATLVPRRRYLVNIYFISEKNGVGGAGDDVPTLKRLELLTTGAGWTETPLVEGIEQLHFEYGVDNTGDGAPDAYLINPATVAAWMNVVTARFFILARNIETSPGYVDTKTYQLGLAPPVVEPSDGYRRHVYSGLVRIANPAGRRDLP